MLAETVTELLEGMLDVAMTTMDLGWAGDAAREAVGDRPGLVVEVGATSREVMVTVRAQVFAQWRVLAAVRLPVWDGDEDPGTYRRRAGDLITRTITHKLAERSR
jgi:hypothetical protein